MSFSKGAKVEWWSAMGSRHAYVQIGGSVYRRGHGIFYTIHAGARVMNRAFNRRRNKRHRISPSRNRFLKRGTVTVLIGFPDLTVNICGRVHNLEVKYKRST